MNIKFNRHEFAGSFGDIGTDFPLIVGIIVAAGLDVPSALIMFGAMQILTGLIYKIPLPVQPLKVMAVIVITQKLTGNVLYGAGLAIGIIMFILSLSGLLSALAKVIPKSAVRGIQFGLGIQLASLALKEYVPAEGLVGYFLAGGGFLLIIFLLGNKRFPAAPFVILLGIIYAVVFKVSWQKMSAGIGLQLPQVHVPTTHDILTGLVLLALPQLPLSLCNSVFATKQTVEDFFPDKPMSARKIGLTYSLMNLINPFFGGIPTCHGSGGLAGHYTFGARTGGSVIIYGTLYLVLGLFFGQAFGETIKLFPKPILGVILAFEGLALMKLIQDLSNREDYTIALLVALIAVGLPYGYLVGLLIGTILNLTKERWQFIK